jgi:transposase
MYLKKTPNKKTGRVYLSLAQGYRDKLKGYATNKTVEKIGYLDELMKEFNDPIAHFKEVARRLTEEEKANRKVTLTLDLNEELPKDSDSRKNFGYAAILKMYYELDLERFFNNKARHQDFEYNTNSIMTLLVVSRILSPGSKRKAFMERGRYFERFNFAEHDVYRALSHFAAIATEAQRHINERVTACYGRDTSIVYYDVTNFYFEIDKEDDLRKNGISKEKRRDPIVQMGLAMDADGLPLHYELFPGNTLDKQTFRSVIGEVRRNYDTGRIIVVADMGIITGDNIFYLVGGEKREKPLNGYVFSFSVRGGTKVFREYVLDRGGYHSMDGSQIDEHSDYRLKSRRIAREINVTMANGKTEAKTVYEKQVVFWSKKYADKARAERVKVILKAKDLIQNPQKHTKATSYGAAKYVKNIAYDKKTNAVINTGKALVFDDAKVRDEEKYDGYYSIVTSELAMSDQEIVDTYRGLWEIEETFKIAKGTLDIRPAYVSLYESIEAHVLSCFIALVILRLLQKHTDRRFSCDLIVDCLNRISCSNEQENIYLFNYRSEISDAIGEAIGIDFTKKRLQLNEVKGLIAQSKKGSILTR